VKAQFDPYLEWLKIPADRRPPTKYDLLGLPPFDASPQRAEAAASERIAYVRKYQMGAHGELAIRVMQEISQALVCLRDPQARQAYDGQLRGLRTTPDLESALLETLFSEPATERPPVEGAGEEVGPSLAILNAVVEKIEMPRPEPAMLEIGYFFPAASAAEAGLGAGHQRPSQRQSALARKRRPQPHNGVSHHLFSRFGIRGALAAMLLVILCGWALTPSKQPVASSPINDSSVNDTPQPAPVEEAPPPTAQSTGYGYGHGYGVGRSTASAPGYGKLSSGYTGGGMSTAGGMPAAGYGGAMSTPGSRGYQPASPSYGSGMSGTSFGSGRSGSGYGGMSGYGGGMSGPSSAGRQPGGAGLGSSMYDPGFGGSYAPR
jgi:hypothetical protein